MPRIGSGVALFPARGRSISGGKPLSGGGIEYMVQVEPQLIDSFRQEGFTSEVPAGLRDIRRIRIDGGQRAAAESRRT